MARLLPTRPSVRQLTIRQAAAALAFAHFRASGGVVRAIAFTVPTAMRLTTALATFRYFGAADARHSFATVAEAISC